jgi:hypothetical protein
MRQPLDSLCSTSRWNLREPSCNRRGLSLCSHNPWRHCEPSRNRPGLSHSAATTPAGTSPNPAATAGASLTLQHLPLEPPRSQLQPPGLSLCSNNSRWTQREPRTNRWTRREPSIGRRTHCDCSSTAGPSPIAASTARGHSRCSIHRGTHRLRSINRRGHSLCSIKRQITLRPPHRSLEPPPERRRPSLRARPRHPPRLSSVSPIRSRNIPVGQPKPILGSINRSNASSSAAAAINPDHDSRKALGHLAPISRQPTVAAF